jgi:hypothetical protein
MQRFDDEWTFVSGRWSDASSLQRVSFIASLSPGSLRLPRRASVLIGTTVTKQIAAELASERSAKYVSYAAARFAGIRRREPEIYASFTFLDTTGTIHHLPVSDSPKYHPLSAVIPRLPRIPGQRRNFREQL